MAATVKEFLELPTVKGLQQLRKTDLLEVANMLKLAGLNVSYRKEKIAKVIAQHYHDEGVFTSEDLAQLSSTEPQPKSGSDIELKIRLIQLEREREKECADEREKERQFELDKLKLERDREDRERKTGTNGKGEDAD